MKNKIRLNLMPTFLNLNNKFFTFLFFLVFFLIGTFIFPDYGISIDEDNTRIIGFLSLESIFKIFAPEHIAEINEIIMGQKDAHSDLDIVPTSGVVFDLPMAFLELVFQFEDSRQYFLLRHFSNFLVFFISVYFFFKLAKKRYNSWLIGILGATFLVISPRIFANSFYNNKDIIFMSLFIINLYSAINFLEKKNLKSALVFSIISALTINVRILGIILPTIVFFIYIINILREKKNTKKILKPLILFLFLVPLFIFIFWPYLWESPLENFFYSLKYLSAHRLNIYSYYLGQYFYTSNPPWHYHLVWIFITTPFLYIALFSVGFLFMLQRIIKRLLKIKKNDSYTDLWRSNRELQDLIFLLTFLIPLVVAIDFRSISYDGWRHLYFIYPSFLLIALSGLHIIKIVFFKRKKNYLYISSLILIIPIAFSMYQNHPHQNVYFNFLAGKNFNEKFEMDYFGISNKEALEYIVKHEDKKVKIHNLSTADLNLSKKIIKKKMRKNIDIVFNSKNADYIINNYRNWKGNVNPANFTIPDNFKIFHEIKVNNVSINTIYKKK